MSFRSEEWRTIPSLPAYEASSIGRVRFKVTNRLMPNGGVRTYGGKPGFGRLDDLGRPRIYFRGKNYRVSRLICETFHGPAPKRAVAMHLDDDPANNHMNNLKWGTQKENLNTPSFLAYCRLRVGDKSPYVKGRAKLEAM